MDPSVIRLLRTNDSIRLHSGGYANIGIFTECSGVEGLIHVIFHHHEIMVFYRHEMMVNLRIQKFLRLVCVLLRHDHRAS